MVDNVKFEDLLAEIDKLGEKNSLPLAEELIYELYKTKAVFSLEGETKALKLIERVINESHEYKLLLFDVFLFKSELLRLFLKMKGINF